MSTIMNNNNLTLNGDRRTKRPSNRPAMQIYRPPGE
ncbi:unnamed protein product [Toxocara canis]|uniref:Uncharacterized protein n=1 Tax=Toxocara canis TaxID=6265 RepID=A0A183U5B6_TOXCA|nr:unnamed protein product [Toxocara canis]